MSDESKMREFVERSGFPFELKVAHSLTERGWLVEQALYFIDGDEQKGREIDIVARKSIPIKTETHTHLLNFLLTIECKKSAHPWVCFTSPQPNTEDFAIRLKAPSALTTILSKLPMPASEVARELGKFHQTPTGRYGRSAVEALGKESRAFEAQISALKAALFLRDERQVEGGPFDIFLPMVIVNAPLFEAYLTEGNLEISRTPFVISNFHYRSPKYGETLESHLGYYIHIVEWDKVGQYFEHLAPELEAITRMAKNDPGSFFWDAKAPKSETGSGVR